jgi:hypothetical protein
MKRKLEAYHQHTWIISSEHFQSRLRQGEVEPLRGILEDMFDEIKIILYLRHPLETAISSWSMKSMKIRKGIVRLSLDKPERFSGLCDHKTMIERWVNVFGSGRMCVRLFQKNMFVKGDLIHDFCDAANIETDQEMALPDRKNQALSYFAIKILSRVRSILGSRFHELNSRHWDLLLQLCEQYFSGFPVYLPTVAEADAFDRYYCDSMRWVHQMFFPHRPLLWGEKFPVVRDENDSRFKATWTSEEDSILTMFADMWISTLANDSVLQQRT